MLKFTRPETFELNMLKFQYFHGLVGLHMLELTIFHIPGRVSH